MGFWVGVALAILFLNFKREPVNYQLRESSSEATQSERAESTSGATSEQSDSLISNTVLISDATTEAPSARSSANTETSPPEPASKNVAANVEIGALGINSMGVSRTSGERDFLEIAKRTGTDKVWGANTFEQCQQDQAKCPQQHMANPRCRVLQGHFYHTIYNKWLGKNSTDDAEPFQFLEIGFFNGKGFDAYKEFLPRAETHSIEIACIEEGPIEEGKWPWGNFPSKNKHYQEYLDTNQLHCGDGSKYEFINEVWTTKMKRPDAPPLKVVVEDAAHVSTHMAMSLFFWFPRIAPGGILVVEDVQPIHSANLFRTNVLPQVLKDLHYCGNPDEYADKACFPTIWPLLQSVHCEMHICVFERNEKPSVEYSKEMSIPPPDALNAGQCLFHSHS